MDRRAKVSELLELYSGSRDVAKSIRSGGLDQIRLSERNTLAERNFLVVVVWFSNNVTIYILEMKKPDL